uniref:ethanolamine kinase n=1 Tax=Strigamia maritima TaxID=126957 RepID=T1JJJ4_STRMM
MLNLDKIRKITTVPTFDVIISSENQEDDVIQLVKCIKPEWDQKSIIAEKMKGGVINNMYKCSVDNCSNGGAVVMRIYLPMMDVKMEETFDHTKEIKNFEKLRHLGVVPELLAVFKNGLCYEYLEGDVLTCTSVRTEEMIPHVTKILATLHALPVVNWSTPWAAEEMDKHKMNYPPNLHDAERMKRFYEILPTKEVYETEFEHIKNYYLSAKSPLVFCHNDTKGENFIWNESKQELKLIDLEHTGMNRQAFEIGSHFTVYTDILNPSGECFPSRDFQLKWIRSYLHFYYKATGRNPLEITNNEVELLYVESNRMAQVVRFFIGTACLSLVEHNIFDSFEFNMINLKDYFDNKDKVAAMV